MAVWEAMAYRSAPAAASSGAHADMLDAYDHAVILGGGLESRLGFATAALSQGRACEGAVLASACKAVEQQPSTAAAHNALGLAVEARGDYVRAVQSYRLALSILRHATDAKAVDDAVGPRSAPPPQGADEPSSSSAEVGTGGQLLEVFISADAAVQDATAAVQLNLARALSKGGCGEEALQLYQQLQATGLLHRSVSALLAFGRLLQGTKQVAEAEKVYLHAFNAADSGSSNQLWAAKALFQVNTRTFGLTAFHENAHI